MAQQKPQIINWLVGNVPSILVSETITISIFPLIPCAKRSILFLIKFMLKCPMIILLMFLTLNPFNLVVKSYSSDSQVAETGNGRLSVEGSCLHSEDLVRIKRSTQLFIFSSLRKRHYACTKTRARYWFLCVKIIWICQSPTQTTML